MNVQVTLEGLLGLVEVLSLRDAEGHVPLTGGSEEGDLRAAQMRGRAVDVIDRVLGWALEERLAPVMAVEQPSLAVVNGDQPGGVWPPPETQPSWDEVRQTFAAKGYTSPEGAMRAWQFPGMDDPYWYSPTTVEDRRGKLARIRAAGGPGAAATAPARPAQATGAPRGHGSCPKCGSARVERRQSNSEANRGRWYRACLDCKGFAGWA